MKRALNLLFFVLVGTSASLRAAAEIDGWGDFRGMRVDGELMPFATSLRALSADGRHMAFTATEMVRNPRWARQGKVQTASGSILFEDGKSLSFVTTVEDRAGDAAHVTVQATADVDLELSSIDYHINLPAADYLGGDARSLLANASATTANSAAENKSPVSLKSDARVGHVLSSLTAAALRLSGPQRWIEVSAEKPLDFEVRRDQAIDTDIVSQLGLRLPSDSAADQLVAIVFPIAKGRLAKGQTVQASFDLRVGGEIDRRAVALRIDSSKSGERFEGVGGNFRVYGKDDTESMQFNLDHLRVPWGRVPMLLSAWQRNEPMTAAEATTVPSDSSNRLRQSMEIAKTLAERNIPLIITTWDIPEWALLPPAPPTPGRPFTIPARRLRSDKAAAVYDAIVSYLKFLKSDYQVEPRYFSINEADLGIDILQTPEEHAEFIREVGRRMALAGLKTRMLLADACSPHPVKFVDAALRDPETVKYIGAVSFHSWHDGTDAEFRAWGEAARQIHVPLFVGEAGTDSDSYRYPPIFQEPWYALYELETNLRIIRESQPLSILHWQMTANYSILVGGGRSGAPLAPGRRFYQIQQLDLTPTDAAAYSVSGATSGIVACAYGKQDHIVAHLLNEGAARTVTITGLPSQTGSAKVYLTDESSGMKELPAVPVVDGSANVMLPMDSFVTIDTGGEK